MQDQFHPKDRLPRKKRRRTRGKPSPLAVVLFALILIALVVTAVVCMLRKPALPTQGAAGAGPVYALMANCSHTVPMREDNKEYPQNTQTA